MTRPYSINMSVHIFVEKILNDLILEFSHQTKTVYVGGLEDGIDDPELKTYFQEFGFVTRALRYLFILINFLFKLESFKLILAHHTVKQLCYKFKLLLFK